MKPDDSPFRTGWWMSNLPNRPCDGTYCLFDYAALPPLAVPGDDFAWLHMDAATQERMAIYIPDYDDIPFAVEDAQEALAKHGLNLPGDFTRLMTQPERLRLMPSCTACYFDVLRPVPSPLGDGAWILPFFSDQQGAPIWSLYLLPGGDHAVVTEREGKRRYWQAFHGESSPPTPPKVFREETTFVAEGFTAFVFRFWFENVLWFDAYMHERPLTPAQQAYLQHDANRPT